MYSINQVRTNNMSDLLEKTLQYSGGIKNSSQGIFQLRRLLL